MADVTTNNLAKEAATVKDAVGAALVTVSTTAALAAVGNAINTKGKYKGKLVFNETTGILVVAADSTAAAVWKLCSTGASTHTPV
jgi:hypothetical protein